MKENATTVCCRLCRKERVSPNCDGTVEGKTEKHFAEVVVSESLLASLTRRI